METCRCTGRFDIGTGWISSWTGKELFGETGGGDGVGI